MPQVQDLTDLLASTSSVETGSGLTVPHFAAAVNFIVQQLKLFDKVTVVAIDSAVSKVLKTKLEGITPESLEPAARLFNDGVDFTFNAACGDSTAVPIVKGFDAMIKQKAGQHWQTASDVVDNVMQTMVGEQWQSMLDAVDKHRAHRCSAWQKLTELMRSAESAAFPVSIGLLPNSTNKVALKYLEEIEEHCRASVPRESFTKAIAMSVMLKNGWGSVPRPSAYGSV